MGTGARVAKEGLKCSIYCLFFPLSPPPRSSPSSGCPCSGGLHTNSIGFSLSLSYPEDYPATTSVLFPTPGLSGGLTSPSHEVLTFWAREWIERLIGRAREVGERGRGTGSGGRLLLVVCGSPLASLPAEVVPVRPCPCK